MDQPPAPDLRLIPYTQASPTQLTQALVNAREALTPYYPGLTWPQWHQAFNYLQPVLVAEADQVSITAENLTKLAHYFEGRYPLPASFSCLSRAAPDPIPSTAAANSEVSPAPHGRTKKTYSMRPDILEALERVSFWRRVGKSALVNLAVEQLMATYSESQIPFP